MPAPKVELFVNGMVYSGWEEMTLRQSIKALARAFDLSLTDKWDLNSAPWPIIPGDTCQLKINSQSVVSGYVDDADPELGPDSKTIRIAGRDKTCDIIDCSPASSLHFNSPLDIVTLANKICAPYGVTASANVPTGDPLPQWDLRESETVFQNLDRAARLRGLLITSDGNGGILFTQAGITSSGYQLIQGTNIQRIRGRYSQKERFSQYVVKSQPDNADQESPEPLPGLSSTATDAGVKRFRRLVIFEDAQKRQVSVDDRAKWEASVRAAKSQPIEITVPGFTKPNGNLWAVNELVQVTSPFLRLKNDELLISDISFNYGKAGAITTFTLSRKDAFKLAPLETQQELWNKLVQGQSQ